MNSPNPYAPAEADPRPNEPCSGQSKPAWKAGLTWFSVSLIVGASLGGFACAFLSGGNARIAMYVPYIALGAFAGALASLILVPVAIWRARLSTIRSGDKGEN